jgi:hypothetical protein
MKCSDLPPPLTTLIALNAESKEPAVTFGAAAASAAHLSARNRDSDPGIKMPKALESL